MSEIKIITASAGTGKTYRLAQELCGRISSGSVRPEAVLLTTFTTKAANELRSRVRSQLISSAQQEAARRLDAALIGTVNSVCSRLVTDYAFELGLSPELVVMDETQAAHALNKALALVVSQEQLDSLAGLDTRLSETAWQETVKRIVTLARTNKLSPADLIESAARSKESFAGLLESAGKAASIEKCLSYALDYFLKQADPGNVKKALAAREQVAEAKRLLEQGRFDVWQRWYKLTDLKGGKRLKELCPIVEKAATGYMRHPAFHRDCMELTDHVFTIAAAVLDRYQAEKRGSGMLDFIDQEVYALQLLEHAEVCERLAEQLDLVMVDEFQDTSPLQLAIFLKLSGLARESIWVGDQKQAIYGFRGTDPALMDAVIAGIESQGAVVETLGESWRSRPSLVKSASDIFTAPFARNGIPEERVRIEAADPFRTDPAGLGSAHELWPLLSTNIQGDYDSIAAGVREVLGGREGTFRVRDGAGASRPVKASDIAILCRSNDQCDGVARALEALDIRACRATAGLLSTPEARLVMAGLRFWIDSRDSLSKAEMARIMDQPAGTGHWLDALLQEKYAAGLDGQDCVRAVREASRSNPAIGPLAAFDAVVTALGVRDRCLHWGDSAQRLANLDALRAHAVQYAGQASGGLAGGSPAGLVTYLGLLEADKGDLCAADTGVNAVTVSTWHSAKGCEWPVTVLFGLDSEPGFSPLGVHLIADRAGIDLADPLAGRWIRYWPNPYHESTRKTALHEAALASADAGTLLHKSKSESLRLLYVAWTRARDYLILATRAAKIETNMLAHLEDADGSPPFRCQANSIGHRHFPSLQTRYPVPQEPVPRCIQPGSAYCLPTDLRQRPPAYLQPSSITGQGTAGDPLPIGVRAPITGNPQMDALGNAVHGFLAADHIGRDPASRLRMAGRLLERWKVQGALAPEAVVAMSDALFGWIRLRWPEASVHREWPVMLRLDNGTVISGTADMVLEIPGGCIIVDHKTFPGGHEQAVQRAAAYGGQLAAYAQAVGKATGLAVVETYIHMPVSGLVVPVAAEAAIIHGDSK